MTEYQKLQFDQTEQGVLGWLLSGLGAPGETSRDARTVLAAGGLILFDDQWACELWRRVEAALNAGKEPHAFKHHKQVEPLAVDFVERVIENAAAGLLVEQLYLPELVEALRARQLKSAMAEAIKTGNTSQVSLLLKTPSASPGKRGKEALAAKVVAGWQEAAERPGELSGVPSGLSDLDRKTWGWQRQNLIIVGARPSQGKTALLIGFARHAAIEKRVPTVVFSLESSGEEIVRRILCQITGSDQSRLRGGEATENDLKSLPTAINRFRNSPLEIIDCPGASIGWIQNEARKLKETMGVQIILVDYLQKVKAMQRNEKRTYEVAQVSEGLKEMAVELDVPVISAGQLNREPEKAKGRAPILSDLADCGQIERDADIVALKYLKPGREGAEPVHQLILAKFRDGPCGIVELMFNPGCARFDNLSRISREDIPTYDKD